MITNVYGGCVECRFLRIKVRSLNNEISRLNNRIKRLEKKKKKKKDPFEGFDNAGSWW